MNKRNILVIIFSLLFSLTLVLSSQILRYYERGSLVVLSYIHFNLKSFIIFIILSILIYILTKIFLKKISNMGFSKSYNPWINKKVFIISTLCIFISGLVFLLYCYPGAAMVDSYQILIDPIGYSFQYPLLYSILSSKIFFLVYNITGSMNVGFFILSLIQLIIMSSILGYSIYWLHNRFKSNKATFLTIFYFMFFFIFSNLNIAHLRDSLFSGFFLLLVIYIYDIVTSNGKKLKNDNFIILFIISITGLLLSRNNGLFIVSIVLVYLLIKYYRYYKTFILIFIIVLFVTLIPKTLPNNNKNNLFQESVAVPFQQIVYSIKYGNVSVEDQKAISKIIPVEIARNKYVGFTFDTLKWGLMFNNFELNKNKSEFMHVWLKNMIPNFNLYTKSFLVNNCDLWALLPFKYNQGIQFELQKKDIVGFQYFGDLNNERILPNFIYKTLDFLYQNYCFYFGNGFLLWIYIILAIILIFKNKKKLLVIFLPFLLIWLNLFFMSPLASAFRYMAMFGYCLPFILCIVFYKKIDCNIE